MGVWGTGLCVGLGLLVLAAVYVTPALDVINHGFHYRLLSLVPFDFSISNYLRLRILTPLVAHVLGLGGGPYLFVPLVSGWLFLAGVYIHFRRRGFGGAEAVGVAALMAFSTPILHQLHFAGYVDTTSYLLVFAALTQVQRMWLWPVLFALALLNHESNIVVAPLLLLAANLERFRPLRTVLMVALAGLAVVPAVLYRDYVQLNTPVVLATGFYLSADRVAESLATSLEYLPLGVFFAFKLFWVFPLVGLVRPSASSPRLVPWFIVAAVVGAAAQLPVASDTSRLMGIAFPAVLFGAAVARERWGTAVFGQRLWLLILWNLLVPQYYIGQRSAIPFVPLPISLLLKLVLDIDPWRLWWV